MVRKASEIPSVAHTPEALGAGEENVIPVPAEPSQKDLMQMDSFAKADRLRALKEMGKVSRFSAPPIERSSSLEASPNEQSAKVATEIVNSERQFLDTLRKFKRLYHDPTLLQGLKPNDQEWITANRGGISDLEQRVGQLLGLLHGAVGVDARSGVQEALDAQSPEQKEASYKNLFDVFAGDQYQDLTTVLPQFAAQQAKWEGIAKDAKSKSLVIDRSRALTGGQDPNFEGHYFNPATPVMQRAFRYKMLVDELAKTMPEDKREWATLAQEATKQMGKLTNDLQPTTQDSGSISPPRVGSLKGLLGRGPKIIS